jgi:outer membrane protein TolC
MGPSLRTWELDDWARSRGLSAADAQQLRAVFVERDRLLEVLDDMLSDAGEICSAFESVEAARRVVVEVSP